MTGEVDRWSAILTLTLFIFSSKLLWSVAYMRRHHDISGTLDAAVVFPIRLPVPTTLTSHARKLLAAARIIGNTRVSLHRTYLPLNFITMPLISVLLLLATGAINGQVVRDGIVGVNGVQPLDIMALFLSLVSPIPYQSTSVLMINATRVSGISQHFTRRHRTAPLPRVLGRSQGWSLGTKAFQLLVCFLLNLWGGSRQRT